MTDGLPAIAVAAVAAGAVSQGVTGLGFSLVCAPFLIAALGPRDGVRTALVLSSVLNVVLIARDHRRVLVREGLSLLVPAVVATPLLAWGLSHVRGAVLTVAAGVLTIVSAGVLASGARWHLARGAAGAAVAGVVSATMNLIGSIGGPAAAIYAVNADWPP
ncbi:MAG TPA: TSUP family transporter, partial [Acidimicrobiales bacterium]|nr:TSUP family transporter [Acidimicrobiales bacterium]